MFSLAYLKNKDTLKTIADKDPLLIYFICYLGNSERYTTDIFDEETDCRALEKYGITIYQPPSKRRTHNVLPKLKPLGKRYYDDLEENGICEKLKEFFDQKDEYNQRIIPDRVKFRQLFWKHFTFDEDPEKIIENKLNRIKDEHNISLPKNYHKFTKEGNTFTIIYSMPNNSLVISIKINCTCMEENSKELLETDLSKYNSIQIQCNKCKKCFYLSYNLQFVMSIM